MAGRRVLVTRPQPGARRTARQIAALGHEPVVLPLTRTVTLDADLPREATSFDVVAVTSANAIRRAPAWLLDGLLHLPCLTVGQATAEAAREAGFQTVTSADGDVQALIGLAGERLKDRSTIAYLCGRERRPDLEQAMRAEGHAIIPIETYDIKKVSYSTQEIRTLVGIKPIDDVMVYSARSARALIAMMNGREFLQGVENARFLCISTRVANALHARPGLRIEVAPEPHEAALLALL